MADDKKQTMYERITEQLIKKIEEGTAPWQKSWNGGIPYQPMNPISNKPYRGINAILLISGGYSDPRWMSYKQASELGAQVKAGEKATPIMYWVTEDTEERKDEKGNTLLDEKGKPQKIKVELERPRAVWSYVFNAEQIDGLPSLQIKEPLPEQQRKVLERAERALALSGATIKEITHSNRACYVNSPGVDEIRLPARNQFETETDFYQTALHELTHWTGHESRLDRNITGRFGTKDYAKEELVTEIGSLFVGARTGVGFTPSDQSASYIESWKKVLADDSRAIFKAAAQAEKACAYIMEPVLEWEKAHAIDPQALFQKVEQALRPEQEQLEVNQEHTAKIRTEIQQEAVEQQPQTPTVTPKEQRVYIDVPYEEKNEAKALGAKWDREEKSWYLPSGVEQANFSKWLNPKEIGLIQEEKELEYKENAVESLTSEIKAPTELLARAQEKAKTPMQAVYEKEANEVKQKMGTEPINKVYLAVPFKEKEQAKAAGAKWDAGAKSWYAGPNADMQKLQKWQISEQKAEQAPAMTPKEEFSLVLKEMGCNVSGEHPIMDGKKHRIQVAGDKGGKESGFYVGHEDGHPAGYFMNNRTGEEIKWKSQGYILTSEQKAKLSAIAAEKQQKNQEERARLAIETRARVQNDIKEYKPATVAWTDQEPMLYLQNKGLQPTEGTFQTKYGDLCIPAMDSAGTIQTAQYIRGNGEKLLAANGKIEGAFHPIGGSLEAIEKASVLIIAEGYATASTITQATGIPVVASFNGGNMEKVATSLHEKYPDKPILIAGDDDKHLISHPQIKRNVGKETAEAVAEKVGGVAIVPRFAKGEQDKDLYGFKDFNDLAAKSSMGRAGVKLQINQGVNKAIARQKSKGKEQKQEKSIGSQIEQTLRDKSQKQAVKRQESKTQGR